MNFAKEILLFSSKLNHLPPSKHDYCAQLGVFWSNHLKHVTFLKHAEDFTSQKVLFSERFAILLMHWDKRPSGNACPQSWLLLQPAEGTSLGASGMKVGSCVF